MGGLFGGDRDDLRSELWGVFFIALSAIGFIGAFGARAGAVGAMINRALLTAVGEGRYAVLALCAGLGLMLIFGSTARARVGRVAGVALAVLLVTGFLSLGAPEGLEFEVGRAGFRGGLVGAGVDRVLLLGFGSQGRPVVMVALAVVAVVLATGISVGGALRLAALAARYGWKLGARAVSSLAAAIRARFGTRGAPAVGAAGPSAEPPAEPLAAEAVAAVPAPAPAGDDDHAYPGPAAPAVGAAGAPGAERGGTPGSERDGVASAEHGGTPGGAPGGTPRGEPAGYEQLPLGSHLIYQLPQTGLLRQMARVRGIGVKKDVQEKSQILEETLESFGVKAKVTAVSQGPVVTRFEMQPAPGVKVSRIVSLANDIALSLAAPDVRIEAPIPGKAAVGVEVPNREISLVTLREALESREFQSSPSPLTIAFGKDITGRAIVGSLEKILHLLIAGATGSGKSVCLNSLITSLLFKARPDQARLLLIDPKMVELTNFNGIPHLLTPVVTDARKAAASLRWVVHEMERRYEMFASAGARDIARYNAAQGRTGGETLPYIVVVIDELADLMMVAPVDVEDAIHRLAQMARASGIHLVVATQRPSVDVITGVIKANIPSRVAFAVSSQVDSRTILDSAGAEKLLGRGDMLYMPVGAGKPVRVQGAYISEREVEAVVGFVKKQGRPAYFDGLVPEDEDADPGEGHGPDPLLPKAARVVVEHGLASVSMVQRKLRVGYTRAARLIDQLEERGFVGQHEGSKPRQVFLTMEEYRRVFGGEPGPGHG